MNVYSSNKEVAQLKAHRMRGQGQQKWWATEKPSLLFTLSISNKGNSNLFQETLFLYEDDMQAFHSHSTNCYEWKNLSTPRWHLETDPPRQYKGPSEVDVQWFFFCLFIFIFLLINFFGHLTNCCLKDLFIFSSKSCNKLCSFSMILCWTTCSPIVVLHSVFMRWQCTVSFCNICIEQINSSSNSFVLVNAGEKNVQDCES